MHVFILALTVHVLLFEERQCPDVEETDLPANVTVRFQHLPESGLLEYGTLAVFGCPAGMELLHDSPHFWQCQYDGNWSSTELPQCRGQKQYK